MTVGNKNTTVKLKGMKLKIVQMYNDGLQKTVTDTRYKNNIKETRTF